MASFPQPRHHDDLDVRGRLVAYCGGSSFHYVNHRTQWAISGWYLHSMVLRTGCNANTGFTKSG